MRRPNTPQTTILRHGPAVRIAHALLALSVIVLIVSGLGMAERLPGQAVSMLGGHVWLGDLHRQLGLVSGVAVAGLLLFGPAAGRRLIRDMCRFHRGDATWFRSFARYVLAPSRHRPQSHDGRFDPGQRIVFAVILGSAAALTVSAAALYLAPAGSTSLLAWALRIHVVAAVIFIAALAVHVAVGVGLLASHRNIGRVMFGDGRVPEDLAHTLWPTWTVAQTEGRRADPKIAQPPAAPASVANQAQPSGSIDQAWPE